ncbi:type II toxin-antitoxin system RelE/ParE family toxin [Maricaulis sp.]|uniref:type II toxin-antitoxin system RelE/ParE family toxin n=1 Tax=Maricaulis sp. TaxID=1486257 RepID=UPI001B2693DA|nr:type II toxin-antitoxin system RelE/ParE family toxin [Maricaulis sp.]MBO6764419.1 type II toxin-antitoxin system RelE/ParE family toxin [Maricaulis sp.]
MTRNWRLTRQAEASLVDIARWTLKTFGPRQAEAYETDLIACCHEIANGTRFSQSCRQLVGAEMTEDLRYARAGEHFVVFLEAPAEIVIVDFLHARSDLPGKLRSE